MNKLIVAAVATTVSGFASVASQAAPIPSGTSVTVVNTAAAPVPTTVQNVVEVDVLAGPPTRARIWEAGCLIDVGASFCNVTKTVQAPAGMVMRVVGVSGVVNAPCQAPYGGTVTLSGAFKPAGGVEALTRIMVPGTVYQRPNATMTLVGFQGNAFFTTLSQVQFGLLGTAATCANTAAEVRVHYVLEPIA